MRTAIVYFSLTGNTEKVALEIARQLEQKNINISKIRLRGKTGNFCSNALQAFLRKKADIKEVRDDFSGIDFIFVGSPVWAFAPTPQVNTFLEQCRGLEGKTAVVFVTYGSGVGKGKALRIMKQKLLTKGVKGIYSFSISDKIVNAEENLRKKIEFALASSPLPYKTDGRENG